VIALPVPHALLRRAARLVLLGGALLPVPHAAAQSGQQLTRERLRVGLYGGAGYANEHASDALYGAGALRIGGFFPAHLSAELSLEMLSSYDRTYLSRLPAADAAGRLQVGVAERLLRGRIQLGYEVLEHWLAIGEAARVVPFVCADLSAFENEVWPQRVLSVGGGVLAELRVHDGLRLMAGVSYVRAAQEPAVSRWLLFGPLQGSVRMQFGAAFAIHPRARLELNYQGELLQYAHSTRVLDTLLFGPVFHVR
jgi:hypothetical protein